MFIIIKNLKFFYPKFFFSKLFSTKYIETFLKNKKMNKSTENNEDDFLHLQDSIEFPEKEIKSPQKSKIYVNNNQMKLNNKLAQGIKVLCKNENKQYQELFDSNPKNNLFILHFGNGK